MKKIFKTIGLLGLGASTIFVVSAATKTDSSAPKTSVTSSVKASDTRSQGGEDLEEMNFVELLNSVPLDTKSADLIRKFQEKEGRNRLFGRDYPAKSGCTVETFRNKEVLLVTIPASKLFGPNDTKLLTTASSLLTPLKRYLREPDMYRVLMVMHTDNTGSDVYRDRLTEERSKAITDWFEENGSDISYLFPFAFGDDMPLVENNSMTNRERNRRLEVYLMPGKKMLEQAKKGRIVF